MTGSVSFGWRVSKHAMPLRALARGVGYLAPALAFVLLLIDPTDAAGPPSIDVSARTIAGVYRHRDKTDGKDGARGAESVMEIVPYGRGKAYVRLRTRWSHGHSCSMHGIFRIADRTLVHDGLTRADKACRFGIGLRPGRFVLHDPTRECSAVCGERGVFEGDDRFRPGQRTKIRYLPRILASEEYRAAVAADEGRIARPDPYLLRKLEEAEKVRNQVDTKSSTFLQPSSASPK